MAFDDNVLAALKPLEESGLLHGVQRGGPRSTYQDGLIPPGWPVTILLKTADPESYRAEIMQLLKGAGLVDVRLFLATSPAG